MSRASRERWLELPASGGGTLAIRVVDVARARYLRLSLGSDGPRLSKPRWVSLRDAAAFAAEKRAWLEALLAERAQRDDVVVPLALEPGAQETLRLRGEHRDLRVVEGRPQLALDSDGIVLALPPQVEAARRRLAGGLFKAWLDAEMRRDVAALLARYTPLLGRAPTRLKIRALRSLWGSLSAQDHLSLDLALILAPPALLDYVVVHELCHLFERNHGPRFWARVAALLPDYRERQRQLRAQGEGLKTELTRLLTP